MTAAAPDQRRRRRALIALGVVALLVIAAAVGGVVWASATPPPMPEAAAALVSDAQVTVATTPWLSFRPASGSPSTGLVFYPGGKIDPVSYAPAARALAARGYLVVVPSMPLNLAVLASDKAVEVMAAYPDTRHWVIGGHSLGGAMAAHFLAENPTAADGLVLWGAYPAQDDDLSRAGLAVTSVSGTRDGRATPPEIDAGKPRLPADTTYVAIDGGNHAQFGYYGPQAGDNPATISRDEQQRQALAATAALLAATGP